MAYYYGKDDDQSEESSESNSGQNESEPDSDSNTASSRNSSDSDSDSSEDQYHIIDKAVIIRRQSQQYMSQKAPRSESKFPEPPHEVFAVGRNESAIVWFDCAVVDNSTTSWIINRYRMDKSKNWQLKGCLEFHDNVELGKVYAGKTVFQLGCHQPFDPFYSLSLMDFKTISFIDFLFHQGTQLVTLQWSKYMTLWHFPPDVCLQGKSFESVLSNIVFVEAPLPSGWFRFEKPEGMESYYHNINVSRPPTSVKLHLVISYCSLHYHPSCLH